MDEILIKITNIVLAIFRWILILVLLLVIFGLLLPYIADINAFPYIRPLVHYESVINHAVKGLIPTRISGYDLSRFITLVVLIILLNIFGSISEKLNTLIEKRKMLKRLKRMHQIYKKQVPAEFSQELTKKMDLLESRVEQTSFTGKNRRALLQDFANIKKELEKIGRDLAFLSIDVENSTEMKHGEDPATVELTFIEYHNFIEANFKKHGLIKASWTPDGVMACFNTIEDALQAAQDIINGLDYFNRKVSSMKKDFAIRCGVNSGHVFYDDSIPLEQFSDRVVDIAGHMQKYAPPNSILIAKQVIEPVKHVEDFTPTKRIVDGLEVYEWIKSNKKHKKEDDE